MADTPIDPRGLDPAAPRPTTIRWEVAAETWLQPATGKVTPVVRVDLQTWTGLNISFWTPEIAKKFAAQMRMSASESEQLASGLTVMKGPSGLIVPP